MLANPLRYGFFKDFIDPTLLFFGRANSLIALRDILLRLPSQKFIKIEDNTGFSPVANEALSLRLTEVAEGMRYQTTNERDFFEWRLSADQAVHFAEQIQGVIDADHPCHDYLDTSTLDKVVVVVSKDEYPDSWPPSEKPA